MEKWQSVAHAEEEVFDSTLTNSKEEEKNNIPLSMARCAIDIGAALATLWSVWHT